MSRCKVCRAAFDRRNMGHKACSPDCAIALVERTRVAAETKAARLDRRRDAEARVALKTRAKLAAEAQAEVNRWVRARDASLPCVSCNRPAIFG